MIFFEQLNELSESRSLVDVRRDDLNVDDIRGFILGLSSKLVLIGVVGDDIQHDGYTVVELEAITFLRWGTDYLLGWEKALKGPEGDDLAKEIDLSNWWGAIEGARGKAALVTFYRERVAPTVVYISDDFRYSDSLVSGRQICTDGQRDGSFALKSDDLTRIGFGGRYESGLERILASA